METIGRRPTIELLEFDIVDPRRSGIVEQPSDELDRSFQDSRITLWSR